MITTNDYSYKDTKLIKQGKKNMNAIFTELAKWINNKYSVNVLNICYEEISSSNSKRPRLEIVLEYKKDVQKFKDSKNVNYDSVKQEEIKCKFKEIVDKNKKISFRTLLSIIRKKTYKIKDLFVIFSAFAPVARSEANNRVTEDELLELKKKYKDDNLWEISKFFSTTTFFFYTDEEVELHKTDGLLDDLKLDYFKILKKYDEFNYINLDNYNVLIDSKENFDNNYESNWYYYYK